MTITPSPWGRAARADRQGHPPSIETRDLAGHLRPMIEDPVGFVMRVHRECGDIARLRMLHRHVYMICDADSVQHVLASNHENYGKDTRDYQKLSLLLGRGLLTSEGELWKRQRRIAQPAFRRKTVAALGGAIGEQAQALVHHWRAGATSRPLDVARAMNALTLQVAGRTLFGIDIGDDTATVGRALQLALRHLDWLTVMPLPYPEYWPLPGNLRFWRAVGTLDRVVRDIIDARAGDEGYRADLLGLLMAARDPETGEQMSREQLRDEIMTMLLAGHETTANALAWTLMFYARHPEVAERVAAEVDEVVGGARLPDAADVARLDYTHRTLLESMRLYPPAWMIARRAREADRLGGYHIPAGAFVYISQYAVHRNPRYWPDAERYDPDRFLADRVAERPKLAYLPFAHGPRKCIGDRFAQMEAVIILAVLARAFRFELVQGHPIEVEPTITLRPRHGLRMLVHARGG